MVAAEISSTMVRTLVIGRPPPVHGDETEHAVLDPVPLAGAGRVVAHGDAEPGLGGEVSEVNFPGAQPVAVGPAGIGGDQQPVSVGEPGPAHLVPPRTDRLDSELGGVGNVADGDPAFVVGDVVDPVGDRLGELAELAVGEVVDLDPFRFAFG